MKPSIQFVKRLDGVKLAYTRFGKGPALVFPAPWVTSLSYVIEDPFASHFWERVSQVATVILYDKHGCGQSDRDRKEFTIESELADLKTVVDHLDLARFVIWGTSLSGPVAISYAFRHPQKVSRLILYGTFANGHTLCPDEVKSALVSMVRASWGIGSKTLADIFLPGANGEEIKSIAKFQRESATPEIAAKLMELAYTVDVSELISQLKVPTLILHREGDRAVTIAHGRELAAGIPNAQFKVLKGSMHPWWYGDTEEIIREVAAFIGAQELLASESDGASGLAQKREGENQEEIRLEGAEIAEQATILFSDIVSSTDIVTKLGDAAARDIFLQHDQIIRAQLKRYSGKELQNLGDGFMLSFSSPSAAIRCACDIQSQLSKSLPSVSVRMAINTGEVVKREGEHPFGQAVVLASRIISKAKGGQVLVSDVTKRLASGSKFPFLDKGRFKPKGFPETIRIHEVHLREETEGRISPTPK
jgi:class 3 adenylate cyclase/pimeloyl-ACP methyl ester carboxylesterase